MQERIIRNKITIISFISSLLVIYFHTRNLNAYGIDEATKGIGHLCYLIETRTEGLVGLANPIFFFISGLLFFRTYELKNTLQKYKSRYYSLVIPYIIWCTFYYLCFVLLSSNVATKNIIPIDMIRELSIISWVKSLFSESYYVLWFLKNLIIFVCISPALYLLLKNHKKNLPSGLLVLFLIVIVFMNYCNIELLSGIEYYLVGSYIGINHKDLLFYQNRIISCISVIYLIVITITGYKYTGYIFDLLFIISLWFVFDLFNLEIELPWWMSITFFSYVIHDAFLELFEKILFLLFNNNHLIALLDYILMPIVVELVIIIFAYLLNKYLPKIYMVITGSRRIKA